MADRGFVGIRHSELGLESQVLEESLGTWLASGWEAVDDGNDVEAPVEEVSAEEQAPADEVVEPEETE